MAGRCCIFVLLGNYIGGRAAEAGLSASTALSCAAAAHRALEEGSRSRRRPSSACTWCRSPLSPSCARPAIGRTGSTQRRRRRSSARCRAWVILRCRQCLRLAARCDAKSGELSRGRADTARTQESGSGWGASERSIHHACGPACHAAPSSPAFARLSGLDCFIEIYISDIYVADE
jgi:hypothetical protein